MANRNLTNSFILDTLLILIVTCALTSAVVVNNDYLPKHNYEVWATVPGSKSAARSGSPTDDAMMRYFLYYMSQMSGNRMDSQRHSYYDRGVKRIGSEFLGKRSASSQELDKRRGSEFVGKRLGSEFLGKRRGSEFVGKRLGSEFLGKRMGSEFVGKRFTDSEDPREVPESSDGDFQWASFNTNRSDGSD